MMRSLTKTVLVLLAAGMLGSISTTVVAEVIKLPVGQQAVEKQHIERPANGLSKEQVESKFGQPNNWTDPVGDPPISSWEYSDFVVFFEYDLVLHSVLKHVPLADAE